MKILVEIILKYNGKSNVQVNSCWSIIQDILQSKNYLSHYDKYETILLPVYNLIEEPSRIDFDEEICESLSQIIFTTKKVSLNAIIIFPHLIKVFTK